MPPQELALLRGEGPPPRLERGARASPHRLLLWDGGGPAALTLERWCGTQGVVRCLYSYFVEKPQEEIPHIPMELHEVKCLKPSAYGTGDEDIFLGPKIQKDAEGALPETS
ncbi:hypothetical protein CYMTET_36423 [Cymbomonas tetramitiformis]|uniref:Uncharacterized protein n=1 Tax=Cymbomonas tetramitiformis TaxID=36881 RepID=A0AAE0F706_9CHLO|nr:hypothetical protein CYMTET_36423 [Cymbomonas tetramitiformis]